MLLSQSRPIAIAKMFRAQPAVQLPTGRLPVCFAEHSAGWLSIRSCSGSFSRTSTGSWMYSRSATSFFPDSGTSGIICGASIALAAGKEKVTGTWQRSGALAIRGTLSVAPYCVSVKVPGVVLPCARVGASLSRSKLTTIATFARCGQVHDAAKPSPGAKAWRGHSRRPRISGQAGDPQPVLTPLC